jgi:serine protease DegS
MARFRFPLFQILTLSLMLVFLLLVLRPDWMREVLDSLRTPIVKEVQIHQENAPPLLPNQGPVSYSVAVQRAAPAVVNIHTAKMVTERPRLLFDDPLFQRFFGDALRGTPRQRLQTSLGSGVIVSRDGYILTNFHVIDGADEIQIGLQTGETIRAQVVGHDADTDLAVLKIDETNLTPIPFGESEPLAVGDVVLAIGNPFGVGQTVTMGIVSATGRSQLGISPLENFIQTDAAINPGNSGGALINAYGQLIGINTAIFSKSGASHGIGFAIPAHIARDVLQQIIQSGDVVRGWIGLETQDLTSELAAAFEVKIKRGIVVTGIYRDSPAQTSGLLPGDILTELEFNGRTQRLGESHDLHGWVLAQPPGTSFLLRGVREGKEQQWSLRSIMRARNSSSQDGR